MDDCLFKPIGLPELSAWLASKFIDGQESTTEASANAEIDLSGLLQYVGGDQELITQLLHDVVMTNRTDRDELLEAHASGQQQVLRTLAHRIKGGALMIRAVGLIECCETLERACREGHAAQIDLAVDLLQQAMTRLDQRLAQG